MKSCEEKRGQREMRSVDDMRSGMCVKRDQRGILEDCKMVRSVCVCVYYLVVIYSK